MTKIVQTYFYPDNTTFDTTAHNEAIMGEPGEGIMGTINGAIDRSNFDTKFQIQPEHVMPEQTAIGRQEWASDSTTIYSDGVSSMPLTTKSLDKNRFRIPGCTFRFYQPYKATFALLQWSFFMGQTRWRVVRNQASDLKPFMNFVAYFDDEKIPHTIRDIGFTHQVDSSTTSSIGGVRRANNEGHSALWYDMSHLVTDLSLGWHELSIRMCMENVQLENGTPIIEELELDVGKAERDNDYYLFQKATFGVRNARVLTML